MEPTPPPQDDDEQARRRHNLAFLAVTAVLVVLGIWLVNKFVEMRNIQNCLDSGRRNCAPITTPGR
jgi:hypothetical protein